MLFFYKGNKITDIVNVKKHNKCIKQKRARGAPKIALINQTTYKVIENV